MNLEIFVAKNLPVNNWSEMVKKHQRRRIQNEGGGKQEMKLICSMGMNEEERGLFLTKLKVKQNRTEKELTGNNLCPEKNLSRQKRRTGEGKRE
jgi:hypothetical protein